MLLRGTPFWRLLTKVDKFEKNVSLRILEKKHTHGAEFWHKCSYSFMSPSSFFFLCVCVCSRQNQTLTSAFNLVENAYIYVSNGWYEHMLFCFIHLSVQFLKCLLERMIVSTGRCENTYSTIGTWCWFNCNSTNIIHVGFVQAECYKNCLEVT